jgi:HK97 family phage portal protein
LGIADNIRGFFKSSEIPTEQKSYNNFPTSQVVFPFNSDAGFFSGVNQMSPEGNSAALACLNVLGTAFSEPPLKVYLKNQEGMDYISNHPAQLLLDNPNPNMTSSLMNNYIVTSIAVSGDAFLLKLRNDAGAVVQLVPLLPEMVEVKGNNEQLITKYQYKQKGNTLEIMPEDMIHLRERIDPRNHRRGLSPLRSVMVEVLGDAAASQMGAALVKNTGVPSVVISPKNDLSMTSDEAENIAEVFGRRFGGENRGRPLVISGGEVDIKTLSFSPKDLEIGKLRYINEERISAVLGVPAILAGLGSGLDRATYSNAKELREFFTEQKLIPMWNHFANEFTKQLLLQDFEDNTDYCFKYDLSDVRALSQDEDATMQRVVTGFNAGFVTVNEARQANQLPALDNGDYFVRNMTIAEVPVDGTDVTMYHNGDTEYAADETVEEKAEEVEKELQETTENKTINFPLYGWQEPTVKILGLPTVKHYRTEIEKKELWKAINGLENAWSEYMSNIYAKELNRQKRGLSNVAKGSHDLAALETNVDIFLNESKFDKELLPLFYSLGDDMSVRTWDNLFPAQENFKAAEPVDLGVQIDEEQAIRTVFGTLSGLLPEGRTIKKVVESGFYRGQREVPAEVRSLFQDSQAANFVQDNAKKVMNDLNATTKKRIATQITKTIKEFEELGIVNPVAGTPDGDKFFNELAKRINTVLGGQNLGRAKNIARTEVGKVSSWSQQRAAKATGKTLEKEWVSRRDGIVREAHFELDNQRVPLNSFYLYNGIKLDAPRDPNAPISLIANCRCTEAYIEVIDE